MSPERNDQEFAVYNSLNVEKLTETLNARADRLCTFLLILLGSAVFGSMASTFWLGLAVAAIAALQFVCRFGEAAGAARAQKLRYDSLKGRMSDLTDDVLAEQYERIHEQDNRPLASIETIAFNKACYMRGQEDECRPLSRFTKLVALVSGGHPCDVPPRDEKAASVK
ncbi:hypothetical protein SAMN05661010_02558 [Modicisalibacter muralis]|uniref:SMODS and SLOG-associating 2TM effector domain-containing protein n=1 Tax=Modicisalibacter muralis TaxID=119000 RepID=A0A1G9MX88_9GAMM|nr:hypothetical protein [Halomonas muralis]SDL78882.1 hypothetical protein SAMN05661010_02558 [Halomonas muralis]